MKKKTLYIIVAVAILLIVVLVIGKKAGWFGKSGNYEQVEVTEVKETDVVETVAATGKIQPEIEIMLSSEVSGEIIELPVAEGDYVQEGDLLVKVNPDIYVSSLNRAQASLQNVKAGLAQAEANLRQAEANYQRNKTLFEKGIISKSEWDQIVANYEMAQANKQSAFYSVRSAAATVSEAQESLGRTNIYAPMSGTISSLSAELGERVVGTQQMAGTEILRVANLSNMEVEVDVNENDIVKVEIGDSAIVEVDAYLKEQFKGIVTEISNSATSELTADQVTNFKVKIRILEDSYAYMLEGQSEHYSPFRPGMTATVDIITSKAENVLAVPISAIVMRADSTATNNEGLLNAGTSRYEAVFVKNGEKAQLREVQTGIQDNSNIEIESGLEEGDNVITGPYRTVTKSLEDGDLVEVASKEELANSQEEE